MKFKKMHGLGNDFVIFDARTENLVITPDEMSLVADRHFGVGCDQIVVLEESEKADVRAYFFNADGSESGACGNASRCVADLVMTDSAQGTCSIEVNDGILNCRKVGDLLVEVDMGAPRDLKDVDMSYGGVSEPVAVNMGNPHLVFFVDDIGDIDVEEVGNYFENHEAFPDRTNVEFVFVENKTHVRQVTWERGVGLTLACGSGACAVSVAGAHRGLTGRKVDIDLDGGALQLEWREADGHVLMTGPVAYVFEGELYL